MKQLFAFFKDSEKGMSTDGMKRSIAKSFIDTGTGCDDDGEFQKFYYKREKSEVKLELRLHKPSAICYNLLSYLICLDGDGSFLMHLGSSVTIAKYSKNNFKYILLNNKSHESVGGQSTNIEHVNLKLFAKSVGYKKYFYLSQKNKALRTIKSFLSYNGPSFLEVDIKINKKENDLPRPKNLIKVKDNFLKK